MRNIVKSGERKKERKKRLVKSTNKENAQHKITSYWNKIFLCLSLYICSLSLYLYVIISISMLWCIFQSPSLPLSVTVFISISIYISVFISTSVSHLFGRRDLRACLIVLFPGRRLKKSARISDMSLDSSTAGNVLVTIASSKMGSSEMRDEWGKRGEEGNEFRWDTKMRWEERTVQDRTGQDRTGQDRTGQDRTGREEKTKRYRNGEGCRKKE